MGVKFSNNGHSTLAASITSSDTSITVASGHGARFPSLGAGDYFYATLIDASNNLEIVKCTARSSDVLTVTRGQESTTARAYVIGDRIELRVTAASLDDNISNLNASNLVSGTIPDARFPSTLPAIDGSNLTGIEAAGRLLGIDVLGPWGTQSGTSLANNKQQSGATGTWTRPSGCNSVLVYVTGGGGGGCSAGDDQYRGMNGASGGTAVKFIQNVASSVSWTVGGGGNGTTNENGSGAGNGGTSSFGSYCSGYGGEFGRGSGGTHPFVAYGGGATGGDLNIPGGSPGFDHSSGFDGQGTVSFWGTHAGGRHRPSSDGLGNLDYVQTGKWGSGGGSGLYDYESASVAAEISGGAGVIVIYKYS